MTKSEALVLLSDGAERSAIDLAAATGVPQSHVGSLLLRLTQQGLVSRRRARGDQDGKERWYYRMTQRGSGRLLYLQGLRNVAGEVAPSDQMEDLAEPEDGAYPTRTS